MNVGTVFTFIMAIIVIAFLLVFGVGILRDTTEVAEIAAMENQINGLDAVLCKRSGDSCRGGLFWKTQGDQELYDFEVPSGFNRVCFFNPEDPSPNPSGGWEGNIFIENIIKRKGYNVVPFKNGDIHDVATTIPKLIPSENFCISSGESTKLRATNLGDRIDLEVA